MTWKELLAWIDENVTTEEVIQSIGRGLGISTEPLAPSYKPKLHRTNSGIVYYAANARNAKTVEVVWNKLQGTVVTKKVPIQKTVSSVQPVKKLVKPSAQQTKQVSPFSGLRNSNQMFLCNHKKECYRGAARKCMDAMALFENRLYYVANEGSGNYKLYTSLEDGTDIRMLRDLGNRECGVSVNSEGIVLFPATYSEGSKVDIKKAQYGTVTWIDWDGTIKTEMNLLKGCLATWTEYIYIDAYVYGQRVYYILRESADLYGEQQERYSAYYVDLMKNTRTTIIKGRKNGRELSKICGTYEKAMFCSEDVWYYLNLSYGVMVSLDDQRCHWDKHVKKGYGHALEILYLNLEKDIMWVLEGSSMLPLKIGTDRNAIVSGMKSMNIKGKYISDSYSSYFDGEKLFVAESYYKLYSKYDDNEWIDWTQGNKHGNCDKLIVLGNYLYVDIDAMGNTDGQFEACTYKIGRCVKEKVWFQRWYY